LTLNPTRSRRGRPRKTDDKDHLIEALSRHRVVRVAVAIIDEVGPEGLSMRLVASRLGVTPMALYNHVGSRADLLAAAVREMLDDARFDVGRQEWRDAVGHCFREMRRICVAHPGLAPLLQAEDVSPDAALLPLRVTVSALSGAGLTMDEAKRAYFGLVAFTLGLAAYQTSRHGRARAGAQENVSIMALPGEWDFDRAFEFGLNAFLDGLAQALAHRDH
jgi:AcrR family transcriptional regulator